MCLCPMECRGRKNQEIKGTFPDPLPPSGSQKGEGLATRDYVFVSGDTEGDTTIVTVNINLDFRQLLG